MSFDRDCSAGFFVERFRNWIPKPNMFAFNPHFRRKAVKARRYLGWVPIIVWRGRSFSRSGTRGIFRRRANEDIHTKWETLKGLALRGEALNGRTMQGLLLTSRYLNASLRVEPPSENGFVYHVKYKTDPGHGIYLHREVNLREKFAYHHLIHSTRSGDDFTREMLRKSLEFYDALGITEVKMTAGLSLGGSMWARYGFHPTDLEQWENCKKSIRENQQLLSEINDNAKTLKEHAESINEALESKEPRAIFGISAIKSEISTLDGKKGKLGQALLMGARWDGVLNLTDEYARYILDNEIGLR